MPNSIITKKCTTCQIKKPLADFPQNHDGKYGRHSKCRQCQKLYFAEYSRSPKGKAKIGIKNKRYAETKQGKNVRRKAQSKYDKTTKRKRYHYIINMVHNWVNAGKIPHAKSLPCQACQSQADEYHHHKGYKPENGHDVIPVCKNCHFKIHNQ